MRISFATLKSVPHYSSFGNNFDLSKELENVINKKLNGDNFDSFVPSSPSQPIIVEKQNFHRMNIGVLQADIFRPFRSL